MDSQHSASSSGSEEEIEMPMLDPKEKKFIYKPTSNDVLLGRGNNVNYHAANVEFRKAAQARAIEYCNSSKKGDKEKIALDVIGNRRFLRPCTISNGASEPFAAWEEVDTPTVIQKTKQALRDSAAALRKDYVNSNSGEESTSTPKRKSKKGKSHNNDDGSRKHHDPSSFRGDEEMARGGILGQRTLDVMNPALQGLSGIGGSMSGIGSLSGMNGLVGVNNGLSGMGALSGLGGGLSGLGAMTGLGELSGLGGLSGIGNPAHVRSGGQIPGLTAQQQQLQQLQQLQQQQQLQQSLSLGMIDSNPSLRSLLERSSVGGLGSIHSGINPLGLGDPGLAMLRMQQERELLLLQLQRERLLTSNQMAQPPHQPSADRLMMMMRGGMANTSTDTSLLTSNNDLRGQAAPADTVSDSSPESEGNHVEKRKRVDVSPKGQSQKKVQRKDDYEEEEDDSKHIDTADSDEEEEYDPVDEAESDDPAAD